MVLKEMAKYSDADTMPSLLIQAASASAGLKYAEIQPVISTPMPNASPYPAHASATGWWLCSLEADGARRHLQAGLSGSRTGRRLTERKPAVAHAMALGVRKQLVGHVALPQPDGECGTEDFSDAPA